VRSQARQTSFPIPPVLPPPLNAWADPLIPAIRKLFVPGDVIASLEQARKSGTGARFAQGLLDCLEARFTLSESDLARIPSRGAAVVVANHPYGILDGLILMVMLARVRSDVKILANSWLRWIDEMQEQLILVNPFETAAANLENRGSLRRALSLLSGGGLLATFPAGEVAHLDWREHSVTDPAWKTTATRLALRARCPVVPVFFEGANSVPFQVAGLLHPSLRTMGLAREFAKMRGKTVRLRIGSPVAHNTLAAYRDAGQATNYLRHRTFFLANRTDSTAASLASTPVIRTGEPPARDQLLSEEVASLPADCELTGDKSFSVYLAHSRQIPALLQEIGRCRELAFSKVGEGSGQRLDLDRFDGYYQHLFLWNKQDRRLAGAYRLAVTSDVIPRFGAAGLYTSTLFRFHDGFFQKIGPALELGRSFVMPEYQKNYAALLLLWKGITRAVLRRPEAPVLFGAVSISQDYSAVSRSLITAYLSGKAAHELACMVAPRRKFRSRAMRNSQVQRLATLIGDIDGISLSIADIEEDGKGLPVLIRQYLKAGGRVLGFSVDPEFSNTLDALMIADLRSTPRALLERCMGREEAQVFCAAQTLSRATKPPATSS
jgi:putative hemolysin